MERRIYSSDGRKQIRIELNNELIDAVCKEIKDREMLKWVIIGISSIAYINEKYDELVKKKKLNT